MDRHDEANSCFRNFANASKNYSLVIKHVSTKGLYSIHINNSYWL